MNKSMELVPSRYNEMPTLVPAFEKSDWKRIEFKNADQEINDKIDNGVCIHVHTFYIPELSKILNSLKESRGIVGRLIITTSIKSREKLEQIKELISESVYNENSMIINTQNTGRNIKPLFIEAWEEIRRYKYCIHLHTKRTITNKSESYGKEWLESIIFRLSNGRQLKNCIAIMEQDKKIGIVMPKPYEGCAKYSLGWAGTYEVAMRILRKYLSENYTDSNILEHQYNPLVFPVGGMMIFRTRSLDKTAEWLKNNKCFLDIKEPLPGQSYLHAIERLLVIFIELNGYKWRVVDNQDTGSIHVMNTDSKISCLNPERELYKKLANAALHEDSQLYRRVIELETRLRYNQLRIGGILVLIKDMTIKLIKKNKNRFPVSLLRLK